MNTKIFLKIVFSITTLLFFFSLSSKAQRLPPDSIAAKTLNSFQKTINQDNYKLFGFQSPAEINNLRLGSLSINVYFIRLDSLKKFQDGDARSLLTNNNQVIYPIYSNDNIVSSIKLDFDGKKWVVGSFGDRETAQYYLSALKEINTANVNKTYLIKIPSLNISLLAVETTIINAQLLGDHPIGELKPGVMTPLKDALLRIKPIANAYNGLPW